jgi:hypothetical protein
MERTKLWPWFPTGSETKICYTGEDQQQFNRPTDVVTRLTEVNTPVFGYNDSVLQKGNHSWKL